MTNNTEEWDALSQIGRYPEAIALCTRSVQDLESDCRAMEVLGYCHHQIGEPIQALRYFDRALALGSSDFYMRLFRARSLESVGHYTSALKQHIDVINAWPALADQVAPYAIGLLSLLPDDEDVEELKRTLFDWLDKPKTNQEWLLRGLFISGEDRRLKGLLEGDVNSTSRLLLCSILSAAAYIQRHAGNLHFSGVAETIRIAPPHDVRGSAAPPRFAQANTPYVAEFSGMRIMGGPA